MWFLEAEGGHEVASLGSLQKGEKGILGLENSTCKVPGEGRRTRFVWRLAGMGGGVPGRVPRDKVEMLSRGQGSGSCALGVGFSRGGSLRPRTLLSRPGSRTSALA